MTKENDLQNLESSLKYFDYTYQMSDDHGVWTRGAEQQRQIQYLIDTLGKENPGDVQNLIDKYKTKYGTKFRIR